MSLPAQDDKLALLTSPSAKPTATVKSSKAATFCRIFLALLVLAIPAYYSHRREANEPQFRMAHALPVLTKYIRFTEGLVTINAPALLRIGADSADAPPFLSDARKAARELGARLWVHARATAAAFSLASTAPGTSDDAYLLAVGRSAAELKSLYTACNATLDRVLRCPTRDRVLRRPGPQTVEALVDVQDEIRITYMTVMITARDLRDVFTFGDPNEVPPARDGLERMQNELLEAVRSLAGVVARADHDNTL